MTGFGAAHRHHGSRVLAVEARSVNHRYTDLRFNVPRDLEGSVSNLERAVRPRVRRGRVDVSVTVGFAPEAVVEPTIDLARARGYWQAYEQLAAALKQPVDVPLTTVAQSPGVIRVAEPKVDPEGDLPLIRQILDEALDGLVRMRRDEGLQLERVLRVHLASVADLRDRIVERMPQALAERQDKLSRRIGELLGERILDEARLAQEVALLADRADVTEEAERLESHIVQFGRLLDDDDAVGRKMDFLLQEMNREANTIGSKCSDAPVAHLVVDLKAELERLREQVQNVE